MDSSIIASDTIIFHEGLRIECIRTGKTRNSKQKFNFKAFDTITEKIFSEGSIIIKGDSTHHPIGWMMYYDTNGHLIQMVDFTAYADDKESEMNQIIIFGEDTMDTIFKESHYLKHKLSFLNEDSVLISFKYRGSNEDISNYAYTLLDSTNKYEFRSNKTSISFSIPILCFKNDSSILFSMIKFYKESPNDEGGFMEYIYYRVKLQEN